MIAHTVAIITAHWLPPLFASFEHATLDFFVDKGNLDLTGINPELKVALVHGALDIAYSLKMVEDFKKQLEGEGVKDIELVDLEDAPQYPWITHDKM